MCLGNREESIGYLRRICKNKIPQNVSHQKYEKLYSKVVHLVLYSLKRGGIQIDEKIYLKCRDTAMDLLCTANEENISRQMEVFTDDMIVQLAARKAENYNAVIQSIKKYVDDHYSENLSIQNVADHVYLGPNYLSHVFRKITGERFTDYVNKRRIEKARMALM